MTKKVQYDELSKIDTLIGNNQDFEITLIEKISENITDSKAKQKLIDYISDEFAKHGLGMDDEPNEYGLRLEVLIDKLNS